MAINTWVNVTIGGAAASQPDRADHKHVVTITGADGGTMTVAWDSAVCTRLTMFDSLAAAARVVASQRLPP